MSFCDLADDLFDALDAEFGLDATFRQGNDVHDVRVVPGRGDADLRALFRLGIATTGTDFLVRGDAIPEPKLGDQFTVNGNAFSVIEGHDGCWRWSDSYKRVRRIHVLRLN